MANHMRALCPAKVPETALRVWLEFDLERSLGGVFEAFDGEFGTAIRVKRLPGDPPESDLAGIPDSILFLNSADRPESRHPRLLSAAWLAMYMLESAGMAFGAVAAYDEGIGAFPLGTPGPSHRRGVRAFFFDSSQGSPAEWTEKYLQSEAAGLGLLANGRLAKIGGEPGKELPPWRGSEGFAKFLEARLPDPGKAESDALLLAFASLEGDPIPPKLLERASAKAKRIAFGCAVRAGLSDKAALLAPFVPGLEEAGLKESLLRPMRASLKDGNLHPEEFAEMEARAKAALEAARIAADKSVEAPQKAPRRKPGL